MTIEDYMFMRFKLILIALGSALVLMALVGSATANRMAVSSSNIRVVYSPLSFVPSFGSTVRCLVTLEATLHSRTITKTVGSLIGYVTRVTVSGCEGGAARADTETLPWHYQYDGFAGSLPSFLSWLFNLFRPSWEVQGEIFGIRVNCRYTVPGELFTDNRESRGVITSQAPGSESTSSETSGCPSGRLSGTGSVTTSAGASITLLLF
jgi:hypothetical protein